jgi:ribosomal protein S20
MPQTKSAKKAMRSSARKQVFNKNRKWKIKNALKDFRQGIENGAKDMTQTLAKAYSSLDKAVKSNLITRGKADRKKARLAKTVAVSTGKEVVSNKKATEARIEAKKTAVKKMPKVKSTTPKVKKVAAKKPAAKKEVEAKTVAKKAPAKKPAAKKAKKAE